MTQRRKQIRFSVAAFLMIVTAVGLSAYHHFAAVAKAGDPDTADTNPVKKPTRESDEQAIRATADEFVKAFNAGDAKAIGAEWAADAEYTDETGTSFRGRAAIEKEYANLFKEQPGATVALTIESIRFLGPDIAVEKGIAKVKLPKADSPTAARYNVVHARRDGHWIIVVGHDSPYVSASNEDVLKGLDWMIGEWKAEGRDQGVRIKSEWMAQHNFIKNTYTIVKDGQSTLTGAQIIGWNPKLGRIVAWHFEANGGFGNDVWTKDGSKWVIEATGMFHDGSESSAVNVITPIDANSFTWQSIKRTLDGVALPNTPPVKIERVQAAK